MKSRARMMSLKVNWRMDKRLALSVQNVELERGDEDMEKPSKETKKQQSKT